MVSFVPRPLYPHYPLDRRQKIASSVTYLVCGIGLSVPRLKKINIFYFQKMSHRFWSVLEETRSVSVLSYEQNRSFMWPDW